MVSLFDRLIGNFSTEENSTKIPILCFIKCVREYRLNKLTLSEIHTIFSLDTAQQEELNSYLSMIEEHQNPLDFIRMVRDWLLLAETNITGLEKYRDISYVSSRMTEEISNGG